MTTTDVPEVLQAARQAQVNVLKATFLEASKTLRDNAVRRSLAIAQAQQQIDSLLAEAQTEWDAVLAAWDLTAQEHALPVEGGKVVPAVIKFSPDELQLAVGNNEVLYVTPSQSCWFMAPDESGERLCYVCNRRVHLEDAHVSVIPDDPSEVPFLPEDEEPA